MNYTLDGFDGALFCQPLQPHLDSIEHLLKQADEAGLGDDVVVISARNVFKDLDEKLLYVPFVGDDCEHDVAEASSTVARLANFLQASGVGPEVIRPDATKDTKYKVPDAGWDWKLLIGLGLVAYLFGPMIRKKGS